MVQLFIVFMVSMIADKTLHHTRRPWCRCGFLLELQRSDDAGEGGEYAGEGHDHRSLNPVKRRVDVVKPFIYLIEAFVHP